jgi:acetyl esterase
LSGRLGDPTRILKSDPRLDPRLIAALASLGLDGAPAAVTVGADSPLQAKLEYLAATEAAMEGLFSSLVTDLTPITNVERQTETIRGKDGNVHPPAHKHIGRTALCVSCTRWRDGHLDRGGCGLQPLAR